MNQFNIALRGPEILGCSAPLPPPRYTADKHDVGSILGDICGTLAELPGVSFIVQGFERRPWPVMIRPDLNIALEQLPEVLADLRSDCTAELDFFEQGVERAVQFRRNEGTVIVGFRGMRSEKDLLELPMALEHLLDMFEVLVEEFLRLAEQRCPELLGHPWIQGWVDSVHVEIGQLRGTLAVPTEASKP